MSTKSQSNSFKITRLDQLEALKSCLRDRICDVVRQAGELTAQEIASRVGARPSKLYPHLDLLVEVGLLVEGEPIRTGKNFARVFGAPARGYRFDRESDDPDVREAVCSIVSSQLRQADREFRAAYNAEDDADSRENVSAAWLSAWLDDDGIRKARTLLDQLDELFEKYEPGPDKSLFVLTYVARPVKTVQ